MGLKHLDSFLAFFPVTLTLLQHSYNDKEVLEHGIRPNRQFTNRNYICCFSFTLKASVEGATVCVVMTVHVPSYSLWSLNNGTFVHGESVNISRH